MEVTQHTQKREGQIKATLFNIWLDVICVIQEYTSKTFPEQNVFV